MRRPETYLARKLRREMTLPEVLLWQRLRGNAASVRFRRQHPIGPYIADFFCTAHKLVIEIDGKDHDGAEKAEHDARRDAFLKENGYQVLRIAAADVLKDVDAVAQAIVARAASPLHHPSDGPPPRAGEELQ